MAFEIDEIHVHVIVREINEDGETVAKHAPAPVVFVNERQFHEWAEKPIEIGQTATPPAI